MQREQLIKKYIPNFDRLKHGIQEKLVDDLIIFNNSILTSLVNKIKKKKCYVIILSNNKKFTDIPEWSHLKGISYKNHPIWGTHPFYKTFDEVRGGRKSNNHR